MTNSINKVYEYVGWSKPAKKFKSRLRDGLKASIPPIKSVGDLGPSGSNY